MSNNLRVVNEAYQASAGSGDPPIAGGGGGGNLSDMEARVKRLETDWSEIKTDLKAIRMDMSALRADAAEAKGKISALPTTLQLLGFILAVLAFAGISKYLG